MDQITTGQKRKQGLIRRLGSEEAYKQYMSEIASKGGKAKVSKGRNYRRENANQENQEG